MKRIDSDRPRKKMLDGITKMRAEDLANAQLFYNEVGERIKSARQALGLERQYLDSPIRIK